MTDTKLNLHAVIQSLTDKAKDATDAQDAMKYSQAALNLANALATISHINKVS